MNNTVQINGVIQPNNCTITWTGPSIQSGGQSTTVVVADPGTYIATVISPLTGCSNIDTVVLDPPNLVVITDVQIENVNCFGGTDGQITILTNQTGTLTYNWTPAFGTSNILSNIAAGMYQVNVVNEDLCSADTTLFITEPQAIEIDLVSSEVSQCGEANGQIDVSVIGGAGSYVYSWNNGINAQDLNAIDKGTYILTVTDGNNCTEIDTFSIDCNPLIDIIVPQFLSPNNDGKNDAWIFGNTAQYPQIKVWVYNRWGNIVYQSENYQSDWNGWYTEGRQVDEPLPAATYFYVIDTMKKSQDLIKGYIEIQP